MLTDKQKQDAIDFIEKLTGEYQDKEINEEIKKQFDISLKFKKKLLKFLSKSERKYKINIIYTALKSIVNKIEEKIPKLIDIDKEATQIAKLYKEEIDKNEKI